MLRLILVNQATATFYDAFETNSPEQSAFIQDGKKLITDLILFQILVQVVLPMHECYFA